MEAPAPACGHPTRDGNACPNAPLVAGDGRCQRHSGLAPTEAQRAASRSNRITHGLYLRGFKDQEERDEYERFVLGAYTPAELRLQIQGAFAIHTTRINAWEAAQKGQPASFSASAYERLLRTLPPEVEEKPKELEEWELVQKVEDIIAANADLLLQRVLKDLKPSDAEEVRAVLRAKGVLRGP